MKSLRVLFPLLLLSAPAFAETSAEALAAFRKAMQEAVSDKGTATPKSDPLLMMSAQVAYGNGVWLSAEELRKWIAESGVSFPPAVQKTAAALCEALDRDEKTALAETEALTRELLDGVMQAHDEKAFAALAKRANAELEKRRYRNGVSSKSNEVAKQALSQTKYLIETWQHIYAKAALSSIDALGIMGNIATTAREFPPDVERQLREKSIAFVRSLGVLSPEDAEKAVGKLIEQTLAATSAKELDPIVQELHAKKDLWSMARDFCPREIAERTARAERFVGSWQEYLAAKAAGSPDRMSSVLLTLTSPEMSVPGVPRSMLLTLGMEKQNAAPPAVPVESRFTQLLAECKTLTDLETKLGEIESTTQQSQNGLRTFAELRSIHRGYQDAKAASQPEIAFEQTTPADLPPTVQELRLQLTAFKLARQFASPTVEGDTPLAFLRRHFASAREAKDWRVMKHVLEAASALGLRSQLCLPSDGAALSHYLAGLNFEAAEIGRFAVASYIAALKAGSDFVPIEELRERLKNLRSKNAADYEEGMNVAVSGGLPVSAVEKEWSGENRRFPTRPGSPFSDVPRGLGE